jgi:hypothetical protein
MATWEAKIGRILVWGQTRQIVHKTPSLNNQSQMDWRCGSSNWVPALQNWGPGFKFQSHKKKKPKTYLLQILQEETR